MANTNIYDMTDTWNAGGTTFTSIKMNVTDTASAAASLLMDLQVGSASKFSVAKDGGVYAAIMTPQSSKSADYTLVLSDNGRHIYHPAADTTPRTFTIPANASVAFAIGSAVMFINGNGAGAITIAITSDTLRFAPYGTTGSRTLAANGIATAVKVTSTEWIISGMGLT